MELARQADLTEVVFGQLLVLSETNAEIVLPYIALLALNHSAMIGVVFANAANNIFTKVPIGAVIRRYLSKREKLGWKRCKKISYTEGSPTFFRSTCAVALPSFRCPFMGGGKKKGGTNKQEAHSIATCLYPPLGYYGINKS